ncbi:MAG TPA: DinB family protein [Gemmatimonadaceae bacterium]|nr:DinB family protein [Gemmatimonadaceae bacterium]
MRSRAFALVLSLAVAAPVSAQGLMADMHRDVNEVQKKLLDLARAIPETAYGWRPGTGVRSVGEVFLHVASDNYLIPISMGKPAPEASGITSDFKSVDAFEHRKLSKDQIIAELDASFRHLHQAMGLTTDSNLGETIKFFGQDWSRQRAMVLTVTHLHEHLGQSIAYARINNVVPPWSR